MRALGLALALVLLLGSAPALADPVVVTTDDAVQPRAGTDYHRIATLRLPDRVAATDVTRSGRVVLTRYGEAHPRFTLLDPATGHRSALPSPGRYPSLSTITTATVWYVDTDRAGRATVYRYDREGRRMRGFLLPDASNRPQYVDRVIALDGDTVWFTTGQRQEHSEENAWSVRFGRPATLQSEGRRLGNPTYADGVLAWSEFGIDRPSHLAQRDVGTGVVTRTRLPDDCWPEPSRVQSNGDDFVLDVGCRQPEGETVVVDRSGELTRILRVESDEGDLGTTDRGTFFYWYFYDLATGSLLDISDLRYAEGWPVGGPGDHPVQVWPQRGGKDLVVRLK